MGLTLYSRRGILFQLRSLNEKSNQQERFMEETLRSVARVDIRERFDILYEYFDLFNRLRRDVIDHGECEIANTNSIVQVAARVAAMALEIMIVMEYISSVEGGKELAVEFNGRMSMMEPEIVKFTEPYDPGLIIIQERFFGPMRSFLKLHFLPALL